MAHGPADFDRLAVVVVNYRSHHLLEANLAPLSRAAQGVTVVVVDNFSTAQELAAVREAAERHGWHLVPSERNGGFGAGMNLGAARALELGAEQLLLLNPDATIDVDSLRVLRDRVAADPLAVVAPVIVRSDGSVWFDGTDLYLDRGRMRSTRRRAEHPGARVEEWLTAACLMLSARLWRQIDGFDEEYFLYWEDVDLSHRARLAGGRLAVERGAGAVHDEGGTHGPAAASRPARAKSETYYYFNIRNRLLYAAKHLPARDRRRWALLAVPAAVEIVLQGGRRQLLHPVAPVRAAVRGTVHGLLAMARTKPAKAPQPVVPQ